MFFFFSPLFTGWHRIRRCLHCYIFITVETCWYSPLLGTKTRGTCTGSGKHDLTRAARAKDSQRSKHCCSSEGKWPTVLEAIGWPQRAAYWAEGNLLKRSTSRPSLMRQVEKRCNGSIQDSDVCPCTANLARQPDRSELWKLALPSRQPAEEEAIAISCQKLLLLQVSVDAAVEAILSELEAFSH